MQVLRGEVYAGGWEESYSVRLPTYLLFRAASSRAGCTECNNARHGTFGAACRLPHRCWYGSSYVWGRGLDRGYNRTMQDPATRPQRLIVDLMKTPVSDITNCSGCQRFNMTDRIISPGTWVRFQIYTSASHPAIASEAPFIYSVMKIGSSYLPPPPPRCLLRSKRRHAERSASC